MRKDTYREKAPLTKTPGITKSMDTSIWLVGTLNQLFTRGSHAEGKVFKK